MDDRSFEQKYTLYKTMIFKICFSYLKNTADSEDAVQNTFIKFYRRNKEFATIEDEKRYLIRIAINASKDILKKKKIIYASYAHQKDENTRFDDEDILDLVNRLKPKYKEIIILKYVNEMDNKEIAKTLNMTESAVRKRQQRALIYLKEMMENDHYE